MNSDIIGTGDAESSIMRICLTLSSLLVKVEGSGALRHMDRPEFADSLVDGDINSEMMKWKSRGMTLGVSVILELV